MSEKPEVIEMLEEIEEHLESVVAIMIDMIDIRISTEHHDILNRIRLRETSVHALLQCISGD